MKTRFIASSLPFVLGLIEPVYLLAQQGPPQPAPWPGPWHHMWGGGWGMMWIFPLLMLLFMAICIASFFFGHRWGGTQRHWGPPWHMMGPGHDPTHSSLQILNERYAKGEIQKDEYEEKRRVIESAGRR